MTTPNDAKLDRKGLKKERPIHQRLWDLVRQQRMELHDAELISDDEYTELAKDHPAVARLETYDVLREANERLEASQAELRERLHEGESNWSNSVGRLMGEIELRDKKTERLEAQLAETQRKLLEWETPMKCGHPRALVAVEEEYYCYACQVIEPIKIARDQAREQRDKVVGLLKQVLHNPVGPLVDEIQSTLAALEKERG